MEIHKLIVTESQFWTDYGENICYFHLIITTLNNKIKINILQFNMYDLKHDKKENILF